MNTWCICNCLFYKWLFKVQNLIESENFVMGGQLNNSIYRLPTNLSTAIVDKKNASCVVSLALKQARIHPCRNAPSKIQCRLWLPAKLPGRLSRVCINSSCRLANMLAKPPAWYPRRLSLLPPWLLVVVATFNPPFNPNRTFWACTVMVQHNTIKNKLLLFIR